MWKKIVGALLVIIPISIALLEWNACTSKDCAFDLVSSIAGFITICIGTYLIISGGEGNDGMGRVVNQQNGNSASK